MNKRGIKRCFWFNVNHLKSIRQVYLSLSLSAYNYELQSACKSFKSKPMWQKPVSPHRFRETQNINMPAIIYHEWKYIQNIRNNSYIYRKKFALYLTHRTGFACLCVKHLTYVICFLKAELGQRLHFHQDQDIQKNGIGKLDYGGLDRLACRFFLN